MTKMSTLLAAMLFAAVSVAHAGTPTAQGATSVQDNVADNKSNGHATTGLTTADQHITAKHGKEEKAEGVKERAEHAARPDRPVRPEHPGR